jgi:hypothetical protein
VQADPVEAFVSTAAHVGESRIRIRLEGEARLGTEWSGLLSGGNAYSDLESKAVPITRQSFVMDHPPDDGPWTPSEIRKGDIGILHLLVDGKDVTFFRDVPAQIQSWSAADPFGDSTAVVSFPQIKPWEPFGEGDLDWFRDWADCDIVIIDKHGNETPVFEGMIASIDDSVDAQSFGVVVNCIGAIHQVDLYVRSPQYEPDPQPVQIFIEQQFLHGTRPHLRIAQLKVEDPTDELDEFKTNRFGSWDRVLTGYLQDLLAAMIHESNVLKQWTIQHRYPRTPVLRHKTMPTDSFWTVSAGAPGVQFDLTRDLQQNHNVFYGEGSSEAGTQWANTYIGPNDQIRFDPLAADPEVHRDRDKDSHPEFDESAVRVEIHHSHGQGVSNAEGIQTAEQLLRRNRDPGRSGSIRLSSDPEEGSRYRIKSDDNIFLKWYRLTEQAPEDGDYGVAIGTIDGYDATWRDADGQVWIDKGGSKEHVGYMFHIASTEMDFEGTLSLTVDTKFRDLLTLSELLERKREGSQDPAKRLLVNRSGRQVQDDKVPWDYEAGSGYIPKKFKDANGFGDPSPNTDSSFYVRAGEGSDWRDKWTIHRFRASTKGNIRRTEIRAINNDGTTKKIKFSVAFFSRSMSPDDMPRDPFHPDAWHSGTGSDAGKDPLLQQPPDIIIGWGRGDQGAGFHPGLETAGDPVTGIHVDNKNWEFQLDKMVEGNMWMAIYAEEPTWFQGRLIHGVTEA